MHVEDYDFYTYRDPRTPPWWTRAITGIVYGIVGAVLYRLFF